VAENSCSCGTRFGAQAGLTAFDPSFFLSLCSKTAWEFLIVVENSCSCGTRFGAQVGLTAFDPSFFLSLCSKPLGNLSFGNWAI
jgi:hypothetical protein